MKILQINKFYYPVIGGIERVVQIISEGLRDKTDIRVLACQKEGRTVQETINDVPILKASSVGVAFSMPVSLSFFYWFNRMKKDSDILHLHMPFPLGDIALSLFGFKGKVVLWWHSDIVRQKRLMFFYKPFLKKVLRRADMIIAATQGHVDDSDYLPDYRDKCVIIPYGIPAALCVKSDDAQPSRLKSSDAPVSFLFVGRLVAYKGCEVLLDAFSKTTGTELVIIGEGPLEMGLKEQANRQGITERVQFWGSVNDARLAQAFEQCDVFVLPSVQKSEAFGLVQAEAMACGKPVINTQLPGGVPYVSLDGVTGITVPPSEVAALARAMQTLADDPSLRAAYGKAARRRAREEFSMEVMLNRVFEQYEKLIAPPQTAFSSVRTPKRLPPK